MTDRRSAATAHPTPRHEDGSHSVSMARSVERQIPRDGSMSRSIERASPTPADTKQSPKAAAGAVVVIAALLVGGALSRDTGQAASTSGRGGAALSGQTAAERAAAAPPVAEAPHPAAPTEVAPSEAPAAVPGPSDVRVQINSVPPGAEASAAGQTCTTPCALTLAGVRGEVTLFTFRKAGHFDTTVSQSLSADAANVNATLVAQ